MSHRCSADPLRSLGHSPTDDEACGNRASTRRLTVGPLLGILFFAGVLTQMTTGQSGIPTRAPTKVAEVRFEMSTALTGPSADLGLRMRAGVLAAFARFNSSGGVQGRRLTLLSLDDGYEPTRTAPNMHTLIDEQGVLGIVGNVGTPTAVAALPIALKAQTPFIGAFSGAGILRKDPPDRYVINYRASYAEETGAMVDALIEHAHIEVQEIAFFSQLDAYGDAGSAGGMDALKRHGLEDENSIVIGSYKRNSLAVENALAEILLAPTRPRAVIMIGAYAPCAKFIRLAKEHGLDALFLNVSFVGPASLARELGSAGDGVLITQVVPPLSAELAIADEYRADLERFAPEYEPSFGSFEGYIVGRMVGSALAKVQGEPTRESLMKGLESLGSFDLGLGFPLLLDPEHHQASHNVWPTVVKDGHVVPIEWTALSAQITHN